jgi:hypothetical protein
MKHIVYETEPNKASDILLSLESTHLKVWKTDGIVCVNYSGAELKKGPVLCGVYGRGGTFEDACYDYLEQIRGKTIVFHAGSSARREVTVLG